MGVFEVRVAFSITATPRKVMTMDDMIINRFWSGGNGKVQPKHDFCRVIIITFGGCSCGYFPMFY
jgi:hypothetical protein